MLGLLKLVLKLMYIVNTEFKDIPRRSQGGSKEASHGIS